jgi:hypothetical protein
MHSRSYKRADIMQVAQPSHPVTQSLKPMIHVIWRERRSQPKDACTMQCGFVCLGDTSLLSFTIVERRDRHHMESAFSAGI